MDLFQNTSSQDDEVLLQQLELLDPISPASGPSRSSNEKAPAKARYGMTSQQAKKRKQTQPTTPTTPALAATSSTQDPPAKREPLILLDGIHPDALPRVHEALDTVLATLESTYGINTYIKQSDPAQPALPARNNKILQYEQDKPSPDQQAELNTEQQVKSILNQLVELTLEQIDKPTPEHLAKPITEQHAESSSEQVKPTTDKQVEQAEQAEQVEQVEPVEQTHEQQVEPIPRQQDEPVLEQQAETIPEEPTKPTAEQEAKQAQPPNLPGPSETDIDLSIAPANQTLPSTPMAKSLLGAYTVFIPLLLKSPYYLQQHRVSPTPSALNVLTPASNKSRKQRWFTKRKKPSSLKAAEPKSL